MQKSNLDLKPLLKLSRNVLISKLENNELNIDEEIKQNFSIKRACFVTLNKFGMLRGCIGSLYARQELFKDVIENTINASFNDPRFPSLRKDELSDIKIEISVLSKPKKIIFNNPNELLDNVNREYGLILKKGFYTSTFLPQVWEQIKDKKTFFEHLSLKAGLNKDDWKSADIFYYTIDSIKEN